MPRGDQLRRRSRAYQLTILGSVPAPCRKRAAEPATACRRIVMEDDRAEFCLTRPGSVSFALNVRSRSPPSSSDAMAGGVSRRSGK